jgi:hypothetical protein
MAGQRQSLMLASSSISFNRTKSRAPLGASAAPGTGSASAADESPEVAQTTAATSRAPAAARSWQRSLRTASCPSFTPPLRRQGDEGLPSIRVNSASWRSPRSNNPAVSEAPRHTPPRAHAHQCVSTSPADPHSHQPVQRSHRSQIRHRPVNTRPQGRLRQRQAQARR